VLESIEQGGAIAYLLVFLAAATPVLEIVLVIPVGVAAGLSPIPVALLALAGNASTVAAVVLGGDRLRELLRRRSEPKPEGQESKRMGRARHVFERWGVPGLAFLGPATTGTHVAAAAALALGASRRPVLVWMLVGLAVWAIGTTVVAVLGLDLLGAL
jgi:hypothetical protein